MRSEIVPGRIFPDFELPDHTGKVRKVSELQGDDSLILTLARGHYCPKDLVFSCWARLQTVTRSAGCGGISERVLTPSPQFRVLSEMLRDSMLADTPPCGHSLPQGTVLL